MRLQVVIFGASLLSISTCTAFAFSPAAPTKNVDRLFRRRPLRHSPENHQNHGDSRHQQLHHQQEWKLGVSMGAEPPEHHSSSSSSMIESSPFTTTEEQQPTTSYMMTQEEAKPIITIGKEEGKQKIVNAFGLWCAAVSILTGPLWLAAMTFLNSVVYKINKDYDPDRAVYDKTGKIWSKVWLSMVDSYPTCTGDVARLKEGGHGGACLYVANHASWLDIPVICTVLDPVFKFIAKGELVKVPCIGQQLTGGHHILIDRDDRRSQLRTFKSGINWLKKGVPLMAFPEGKRSPDGRLMDFKGGLFSMAVKTKVPIVPITISNAHAVMPSYGLFPVQRGAGKLHVHVHEAIETEGKTEAELGDLVRTAFLSQLPPDQHPLDDMLEVVEVVETPPPPAPIAVQTTEAAALHHGDGGHEQQHHHHHDAARHAATKQTQQPEEKVKEVL